ncbi:hypothetical protein HDR58_09490 [bacterium]|nr:hypothetical protein [bacterium]
MKQITKSEKLHSVYVYCKENFKPSDTLFEDEASIKDENELRFFRVIHEFFLQERQREYLNNRRQNGQKEDI